MFPKYSRADVYKTDNKVVSLGNSFEGEYIIRACNKIGEYDGTGYVHSFDIYEFDGIRFLHGMGAPVGENNFNYRLMKECGNKIKDTCPGFTRAELAKQKKLVKKFCDSIHKGITSPGIIKSWDRFERNLIEQKDFFPKRDINKIAKELLDVYTVPEAKQEINLKILEESKYIAKHHPELFRKTNNGVDELYDRLKVVFTKIYKDDKERYKQAEKKRLREYDGYEHF